MIILNIITIGIVFHSALHWSFQILITGVLVLRFKSDWVLMSPCPELKSIRLTQTEWVLETVLGGLYHYQKAKILIHNELFQLIQLTGSKNNKKIILFNDQIPKSYLKILHLRQL